MPWLVGTALLHSLMVTEKRQQFIAWTLLLAISAFSLSLVGTFLVRSGVLTSVHAFAVDPARGLYILLFLLVVIGGSLVLFAVRASRLQASQGPELVSRESALLLNNVFLMVAMLTVLMGTVYPLLVDGLGLGKLSVGAPYFNTVFTPLMAPLFLLMGFGVHMNWRRDGLIRVVQELRWVGGLSLILPAILLYSMTESFHFSVYLGLVLAFWILFSTLKAFWIRLTKQGMGMISQGFMGMMLAHIGVAAVMIGIVVSSGYGLQDDVQLAVGQTAKLGDYHFTFVKQAPLKGPNYTGTRAEFLIQKGHHQNTIYPEKRLYDVGQMAMTESAIDVTPFRDVYIALGESFENNSWSIRLYVKPFIRWIWSGGFLILAGGIVALSDRRYYQRRRAETALSQEVLA
jgi:cytochrome c-type biogenesis protein CcmF